jgi:large subunit ribosomal protein L15
MPLQRRLPKRGFTNIFKKRYGIVNVGDLQRFEDISEVGPLQLRETGLVKKIFSGIKLLADGEINRPMTIQVHFASEAAVKKVEAAGGRVELIPPQNQKRN